MQHIAKYLLDFLTLVSFVTFLTSLGAFPYGSDGKESTCNAGDGVQSLGQEDPLKEGMAIHSTILAWRIPWTEEPGGLSGVA